MRVLVAGGLCGTTMLSAAEKIRDRCDRAGLQVTVKIQNLWETTYVEPGTDLIVEMFPFFRDALCPVLSGRPFILRREEEARLREIILALQERAAS